MIDTSIVVAFFLGVISATVFLLFVGWSYGEGKEAASVTIISNQPRYFKANDEAGNMPSDISPRLLPLFQLQRMACAAKDTGNTNLAIVLEGLTAKESQRIFKEDTCT